MSQSGDNQPPGRHLQPVGPGSGQMAPFDPHQAVFEDDDTIDLLEYWRMLVKRKWVVFSFLAIVFFAVLFYTLLLIPEYRATATIQINPDSAQILSYQDFAGETRAGAREFYATQYDILRSRTLAEGVVESHGLRGHPELAGEIRQRSVVGEVRGLVAALLGGQNGSEAAPRQSDEASLRRAANRFLQRIQIEPVRNSQLVNVHFVSFDPAFAADMANAIVNEYSRSSLQRRYEAGSAAREFLQEQLDEMRISLERSDQALMDFAERNGIADLDERLSMSTAGLRELSGGLDQVEGELLGLEADVRQIQSGRLASLEAVQRDDQIRSLEERMADSSAEHSALSQRFLPEYPAMVELRERMSELRQQMQARQQAIAQNITARYENLENRRELLEQAIARRESVIMDLNQRAVQYNILRREFETNRELYDGLLQRMKEIGVAAGAQENNISVVDAAVIPASVFKPDMSRNMMLAVILGLLGGAGLAILLEYLDRTIRSPEEMERLIGGPMLGLVPLVRVRAARKGEDRKLKQPERLVGHYSAKYPKSSVSEAFRSLRTSLMFSGAEGMPRSLLITSPGPADGKTTTALNLATVMAQNGARVLLIDGDLRKPWLHRDFGKPKEPGLTNRIARLHAENSSESIIQGTDVENLFFLPSGTRAPNPAEMLGSPRMQEVLKSYEKVFDHIIIDSAPILGLADSMVISKMVGGVVLVVAAGRSGKDSIAAAVKRLRQIGAPLLGGVLNAVDMESPDYSYYSAYYYNYDEDDEELGEEERKGLLGGRGSG